MKNDGSFELSYDDTEYRIRNPTEKRPDLFLMVLGPEDADSESPPKILFSSKLLRQNSGRIESYYIRISSQQLKEVDINPPNEENESSDNKIQNYIKEKDAKFVLNEGIAKYHKTIADDRLTERKSFKTKFKNLVATNIDNFQGNGVFVKDGGDIFEKTAEVINEGVKNANEKLGSPGSGVPINLYLTPKDRKNLKTFFDNAVDDIAEIPESFIRPLLFRASSSENIGTLLINNNPIAKFCRDKTVEEACAKTHLGGDTPDHDHDGNNENGNGNGEGNGDGNITGPNVTNITSADIPTYVAKLISDMRSPDYVMNPDKIQSRPNQDLITKSVNSLSLARGPADAPAYYDFHSLQIAFEYVWKQLFDEDIIDLGYNLHTKVLQRTGINPIMQNMLSSEHLKSLATIIFDTPIAQMSANVAAHFDITKEEWNDLDFSLRAKLEEIAQSLTDGFKVKDKYYQELHEQGERLIDSVRHDDYYTMHKTLRDLHDRLNSNYEYTIFGADNNHWSVNFGLLNTFRQKWLPLNYQVGKLRKTIPLAPKEERKYSLKITKHFKRNEKEARKNNTSFTNEQTTTSRSEAEIIAKAQNKTNFNLSAEGTYNIGISKGDVKTSLGIDAQNESQQSRKDFREAVPQSYPRI